MKSAHILQPKSLRKTSVSRYDSRLWHFKKARGLLYWVPTSGYNKCYHSNLGPRWYKIERRVVVGQSPCPKDEDTLHPCAQGLWPSHPCLYFLHLTPPQQWVWCMGFLGYWKHRKRGRLSWRRQLGWRKSCIHYHRPQSFLQKEKGLAEAWWDLDRNLWHGNTSWTRKHLAAH